MKLLTFKTSQGEAYRKRNAFATQNHPKLIWVIYRKQYCSTSSLSFDVWITLLTKKKVILGISTPALAEFSLPYRSLNKMQWEIRRGMMTEQYFTVTAQPCHSNVAGTRDMTTFITPWGFFCHYRYTHDHCPSCCFPAGPRAWGQRGCYHFILCHTQGADTTEIFMWSLPSLSKFNLQCCKRLNGPKHG